MPYPLIITDAVTVTEPLLSIIQAVVALIRKITEAAAVVAVVAANHVAVNAVGKSRLLSSIIINGNVFTFPFVVSHMLNYYIKSNLSSKLKSITLAII